MLALPYEVDPRKILDLPWQIWRIAERFPLDFKFSIPQAKKTKIGVLFSQLGINEIISMTFRIKTNTHFFVCRDEEFVAVNDQT